jgi:predicted amino acid-binding ACT domain protein
MDLRTEINWIPNGVLGQIENHKRDSIINGNRIIPIRWADQILRVKYENCMRAKYDMYSIDWQSWRLCDYQRDQEKENELFYSVLGLVDFSEPFRLINQTFTSLENNKIEIPESKEIRNVYMKNIPGFSLFDWSKVIEKATEIHTVSTSINYLIEMLEIKAKAVDLYVRKPQEKDFKNIQYQLSKCCNPIPGDNVFGFITISEGIKIHRYNCPNAEHLMSKMAYRCIKARWQSQELVERVAAIKITGIDNLGLVNRLTEIISNQHNVNMKSISFETEDGIFEGKIRVLVFDTEHLEQLMAKFEQVDGVQRVMRWDVEEIGNH